MQNSEMGSQVESGSFLFEVSWEVCNRVGGIHTVLRSKVQQVLRAWGDNYCMIGPWRGQNREFIEKSSPFWEKVKEILALSQLKVHVGYWDLPNSPKVILVDFGNRYKIDQLLYSMWTNFGVDSLSGNYDYHEPILFATAAAEVISLLQAKSDLLEIRQTVAHFHEWMCGAGVLYLKKNAPTVATVFTTHATVLGRSIAQDNRQSYNLTVNFNADDEAKRYGVFAKHSLEKISAREANYFTAVSSLVAHEAEIMLGKYPDKVVCNGIDVGQAAGRVTADQQAFAREKLLAVARQVIGQEIGANALLLLTSGRYEFHNKGYDLLLKSLAQLEEELTEELPPVVIFLLIAANWHTRQDSLLGASFSDFPEQREVLGLATHKVYHPEGDQIVQLCRELNLRNPGRRVHIVFSDAYLTGGDGVFDLTYEQILAGCDGSVFPSFYEPWGYTPLESLAYSTPTVTTDLAGFGCWAIENLKQDFGDALYILKRRGQDERRVVTELRNYLLNLVKRASVRENLIEIRHRALELAHHADWDCFYPGYLRAYQQAVKFNQLAQLAAKISTADSQLVTSIQDGTVTRPRLRPLQYECRLPQQLSQLRELAYNLWWAWHSDAKELFQKIDPELWEGAAERNPVHFLNLVSAENLQLAAENPGYLTQYHQVIRQFEEDLSAACTLDLGMEHPITAERTIAYFCMEYGIDESLPIYSGGLGILAGDYLKAMSDFHIPAIALGLFYKRGYFLQQLNAQGEQEAMYNTWDTRQIPMSLVNDGAGNPVLIGLEVLGRTIYLKVWEVKVGRVKLYLLDTDVAENSAVDREITSNLYGGSREIRLLQEMVLGIGGARFISEKLKISPQLYHLNEGHSAFLLLERIRELQHQGWTFGEALELVKSSSVFTTHTPVAAGNEVFSEDLARRYLGNYATTRLGISFEKLFELARDPSSLDGLFSMTALALRLTLGSNGVSQLHGQVARRMWQTVWPGLLEREVPITAITNGVHLGSWLGDHMLKLYDQYLAAGWLDQPNRLAVWEKIRDIPDGELWNAHQQSKERLIEMVKQRLVLQYTLRDESKQLISASLRALDGAILLVGLSRRFTAYKRNNLFSLDRERLARILGDERRPVVILVAGKAHPADSVGKELIREIIETLRMEMFNGHIIFLEEYNIALAKLLVQGVDVWLNTPILGREACGTSGMKVGINGGLNFSTRDGWWSEAYGPSLGWQVESLPTVKDLDKRAAIENNYLLDTLESEIVPLYYRINRLGFNPEWVQRIKNSICQVAGHYNTARMVLDYVAQLYAPVVKRNCQLMRTSCSMLKALVAWQQSIVERFNTLKINAIFINGVKNGKIISQGLIQAKILLYIGKMTLSELWVELVIVTEDRQIDSSSFTSNSEYSSQSGALAQPTRTEQIEGLSCVNQSSQRACNKAEKLGAKQSIIIPLKCVEVDVKGSGVLTYVAEYQLQHSGFYSYGIRILPHSSLLFRSQDAGIIYWG